MGAVGGLSTLPFQPVGGQPAFAAEQLERFVAKRRVAVLGYLRSDGRPHQVPIWYTYRDGTLLMSSVTDSPKHRALLKDPRVSLTIQDEAPPYRAVILEGVVTLSPIDPANDPTQGVAVRYFGRVAANEYHKMTAELYTASGLTLIALTPSAVRGFDNHRALSKPVLAFVKFRERLPIPRSWL